MKIVRRLLTLLVMGLAFAAAYQFGKNADPLSVTLFRWTTPPAPTWLVLLSAFGAGVLVAGTLLAYQLVRLSFLSRRYRKEVSSLESELHRLRNLPLAPGDGAGAAGRPAGAAAGGGAAAVAGEGRRG
jgi:uncharacterized integral membrane protein